MGLRVQNYWNSLRACLKGGDFGCVGVSLGRLGFAGGLGVMEAASAASWGSDWPISILGVELTRGFHLNGSFWDD